MSENRDLPLFPLNTVLVPGGNLPLRIFEPRYLDMVRECTRRDQPFGVVLVLAAEDQHQASHVRVGTEAWIRDFNTLEDGLLGISCRGGRKFVVQSTRYRDNGLLMGTVSFPESTPPETVPSEFGLLADIVRGFMERLDVHYPEYDNEKLEDADWVGYRLTELLPLEDAEKQALLELREPLPRLQVLLEVLPRFQSKDPE